MEYRLFYKATYGMLEKISNGRLEQVKDNLCGYSLEGYIYTDDLEDFKGKVKAGIGEYICCAVDENDNIVEIENKDIGVII